MIRWRGKQRGGSLFRILRFAVLATLSLLLVWIIGANVFLSTSLFERVTRNGSVSIHYRRAWSLFPQRVHVKDFVLVGHDSSLEWEVKLDDVELDISIASLFEKRFEGSHVRGKGVTFRLRKRPDVPPSAEELAALPSIQGLPAYSLKPPPKPPGPPNPNDRRWNDAFYRLWTLDLEDVVARDVREVWVQQVHFQGNARVDGRWYFKPIRAVEVGPVRVAVDHGGLVAGAHRLAEDFDGSRIELTIPRFDPRVATDADLLGSLSLKTDAHATLPAPAILGLPAQFGSDGPIEVKEARVRIDEGRFEKDTRLQLVVPKSVIDTSTHHVTGALALAAEVTRPGGDTDRLDFQARLEGAEVSRKNPMRSVLRAKTISMIGDAHALELVHPLTDLHLVVDVPEGTVNDTKLLSRYIPQRTHAAMEDGGAKVELHVEAFRAERRAVGHATLQAEGLDFRLAKMRVRGRGRAELDFASYHFDTHLIDEASMKIRVRNGTLASTDAPETPLVHLDDAEISATAPNVDVRDPLRDLSVAISLPSAEVVSRGLLHAYLPKGSEMQVASSRSRFALEIRAAVTRHLARGTLSLRSKDLRVFYRDRRLDARIGVGARVHDWRWETGNLVLDDARVDVEGLTMKKGDETGLSIARIGIAAKSQHFKLTDPLAKVRLTAFFEEAKVRDPSTLSSFLPAKSRYRFEGTEATFGARLALAIEDHVAAGRLRVTAANLGVAGEKVHLMGDVEIAAEVKDWSFEKDKLELRGAHVEMAHVKGRIGHKPGESPDLSLERLRVAIRSPELDLVDPSLKDSDFRLVVEKAFVPDTRNLTPLLSPDGLMKIESGTMRVDANVEVSHSRNDAWGAIEINLDRAAVLLRKTRLSGDFRFVTRLSGLDSENRALDLSGTRLEMRNVAVSGATAKTSNWRGDVTLAKAWLRVGPEMALDTTVKIDARDMRPILAIVFENDLPKIVVRLTDMPRLSASARLLVSKDELGLLDLDARGGNFAMSGSYAVRGQHREGGVIFKKAFVSVGLRLDDGGTHLRFFRLKSWLRKRNCAANVLLELDTPQCENAQPAVRSTRREKVPTCYLHGGQSAAK